jgi:hypothetical protein
LTPQWAVDSLTAIEDFLESHRRWTRLASFWMRAAGAAAAGLALGAATTADVPPSKIKPVALSKSDPRAVRLDRFFSLYHCLTPYYTFEYLRAADGYGLDYRLLPAVSIRESSCGLAYKQPNNLWGYHPGHQSFPSIAAGIDFLAQRLTQHPYYKGKTLEDKLFMYNPRAEYPDEVQRIMRQIE